MDEVLTPPHGIFLRSKGSETLLDLPLCANKLRNTERNTERPVYEIPEYPPPQPPQPSQPTVQHLQLEERKSDYLLFRIEGIQCLHVLSPPLRVRYSGIRHSIAELFQLRLFALVMSHTSGGCHKKVGFVNIPQ